MVDEPRLRLGRGLAALIGEAGEESLPDRNKGQKRIPIEFVRPNPRNPRKSFESKELDELTESIREKGILQPIVVRELAGVADAYEIIAGERRWRAAQRAALHTVPVVIIEATDRESLELAIIENVQRADLNALEEADGYQKLIQDYSYSQSDLARIIGKSRSHVANTLRLINLPAPVKAMLGDGSLSAGHARALLTVDDPEALARRVVAQGLSVRDVEKIAQSHRDSAESDPGAGAMPQRATREKDPDTRALEASLQEVTGLTVSIAHRGERGHIRLDFKSLDQLDRISQLLLNGKR